MPRAIKEIESVALLKSIKVSLKNNKIQMKRLRIHAGLHKKYYLKLKNFELILTQLQAEIQDRVDGLQVNHQDDPEAPANPPETLDF